MIRAAVFRALVLTAAFAAALTPIMCFGQTGETSVGEKPDAKPGEASKPAKPAPPKLPPKATKKLPPEMLALLRDKNMPISSPILVRVFKEESELEVWKQDATGRFQFLKTYPICRWSGDLGPNYGRATVRLRRGSIA